MKKQIELPDSFDELDEELSADEYELYSEQVVDQATAAETIPELEAEIWSLKALERRRFRWFSRARTRSGAALLLVAGHT